MQRDRRVVDERELSDSEDEDGDKRRNQSNAKQISNKRKASSESINGMNHSIWYFNSFSFVLKGITVNGDEEFLPAGSAVNTIVSQVKKMTESIVTVPSSTTETTSSGETILTRTKEEVTETTTVVVKDEPSGGEKEPAEALKDDIDTKE